MKHVSHGALLASVAASALVSLSAKAEPRAVQSFRPHADANDPGKILAQLQKDFADFKAANDEKLNGKADVLLDGKVDKINGSVSELQAAIDDLNKKLAAAQLAGAAGDGKLTAEQKAYSKAFSAAFRRGGGNNVDSELAELAVKAGMTTQSDPDGGWMVPVEMEPTIDRILMNVSAMRGLAQVQPITAGEYKKLVSQGGAIAGWAGETDPRTETANAKLAEIVVQAMELWANPFASQTVLDDARLDLAQWIGDEVSISFAEQEGAAFINGNGVKKPRGILNYPTVADAQYAWGKLGFIGTGGNGFAADPAGLDALIDLTQALKRGYRANATWLANRKTYGSARKLKDSQGHYQWQPSTQVGQPATLLGYPAEDDDNMPDAGANHFPMAFGDFRRGYLIADRIGIRVLRDPFTNKPFVGFYTTKRVGGGVQNFEAIKLLKNA